MTKAERIYNATRRQCKDIITGTYGYMEGQSLSGLVTEEAVCMRTINAIMKLVDKEEHRIRLDEELGVLSGEKLQLYINVNNMVRKTVEDYKAKLQKWNKELKTPCQEGPETAETVESVEETTVSETVEEAEQEETKMKKYYFASGIRGIVGEHSGNIRGAKAKAQKLAEQLDEEITIFVRSNKEIDCGKNIPANEEVCRVCNADGDVLAVCSTYGNAFAWCAENGIEGEIGEYEPYIEVGTYSENGNFEVEDYSSINTGDGMWNIINDYCYYVDKVCPEAIAETVESVEVAEETAPEAEQTAETAEQETELNAEVAEVEAEQIAEPETFSYEFNEIHKITISKRNNVYVEEFFEKMGGSYVKLGEKTWGCIEDIEEYYGIKINRNVQTNTEESESESESESEPTVNSNTVETITHTGYFDTS